MGRYLVVNINGIFIGNIFKRLQKKGDLNSTVFLCLRVAHNILLGVCWLLMVLFSSKNLCLLCEIHRVFCIEKLCFVLQIYNCVFKRLRIRRKSSIRLYFYLLSHNFLKRCTVYRYIIDSFFLIESSCLLCGPIYTWSSLDQKILSYP